MPLSSPQLPQTRALSCVGTPARGSPELWGLGGRGHPWGPHPDLGAWLPLAGVCQPRPVQPRYPWNLLMAAYGRNAARCQASPRVGSLTPCAPPCSPSCGPPPAPAAAPPRAAGPPPRGPHDTQLKACKGGEGGVKGAVWGGEEADGGRATRGRAAACHRAGAGPSPGGATAGKGPSARFCRPRSPLPGSPGGCASPPAPLPVPPGPALTQKMKLKIKTRNFTHFIPPSTAMVRPAGAAASAPVPAPRPVPEPPCPGPQPPPPSRCPSPGVPGPLPVQLPTRSRPTGTGTGAPPAPGAHRRRCSSVSSEIM